MDTITRKGTITDVTTAALSKYRDEGLIALVDELNVRLLQVKVKFPMLEYAAHLLTEGVSSDHIIPLCDRISALQTEGGNVLLGILLQNRLTNDLAGSIHQATLYIAAGQEWYVSDLIGERVMGVALLQEPVATLKIMRKLKDHESPWVVRSLGAGSHYAMKKGLPEEPARKVFELLLSLADAKHKHIKTGIGWAAKTTAKFHPQIIESFQAEIADAERVGQWFRTKVKIGLQRHAHAQGN